jgi:ArsR family transcriptional regulator, virulence genes transcriptional regulator
MQEDSQVEIFRLQAELCKALSDPKRLRIIRELRYAERTVTELMDILGLKQSNTSQHLGVLRRIGVISSRREGNTIFYRLANPRIAEACDLVHQVIAEHLQNSQSLFKAMEHLA